MCIFIVLTLILVAGFRKGMLGGYPDYQEYVYSYIYPENNLEFSFNIICSIARFIDNGNYYIVFLIYAILGVLIKFFALAKLSNNIYLSLAIYVSFFYPLHDLIQIRAGVATGILLFSVREFYHGCYYKFIGLVVLAACFHLSALLFFILPFFNRRSFSKSFWILLVVCSFIVSCVFNISLLNVAELLQDGRISDKIIYYQMAAEDGMIEKPSMFSSFMLLNYFIMILLFVYADKIVLINKYFYTFFKLFLIGIIFYILFVKSIPTMAIRCFELFSISLLILIPLLFYVIKNRSISVVLFSFIGVCFLYVMYVRGYIPVFYI